VNRLATEGFVQDVGREGIPEDGAACGECVEEGCETAPVAVAAEMIGRSVFDATRTTFGGRWGGGHRSGKEPRQQVARRFLRWNEAMASSRPAREPVNLIARKSFPFTSVGSWGIVRLYMLAHCVPVSRLE